MGVQLSGLHCMFHAFIFRLVTPDLHCKSPKAAQCMFLLSKVYSLFWGFRRPPERLYSPREVCQGRFAAAEGVCWRAIHVEAN